MESAAVDCRQALESLRFGKEGIGTATRKGRGKKKEQEMDEEIGMI